MVEFSLNMRAFSVNKMATRDARFKTKEFQDWFTEVVERLRDVKELQELADDFRAKPGPFEMHMEVQYPHHIFYNKAGHVSAKTFDCSNVEKPFIDALFREVMGVDDRNIIKLVSTKSVGATYAINVKLELIGQY